MAGLYDVQKSVLATSSCKSNSLSKDISNGTAVRPRRCGTRFSTPTATPTVAYYWVDTQSRGGVPTTALRGGTDIDGTEIFVGRAFHEGDWIPAKVMPGKKIAYIPYGGKEIPVHKFQVLCEQSFDWVPARDGQVPQDAVIGGKTSDGENLYIGRASHNGSHTVGKVQPSHKTCYIPFDGKEVAHKTYEILVLRP